jgi:hypothetical protein
MKDGSVVVDEATVVERIQEYFAGRPDWAKMYTDYYFGLQPGPKARSRTRDRKLSRHGCCA